MPREATVDVAEDQQSRCPQCGGWLDADWDVEFMLADRRYFEEHPERRSYRRFAFPEEHPFSCCGLGIVEVTQMAPGVRARFGLEGEPIPLPETNEAVQ